MGVRLRLLRAGSARLRTARAGQHAGAGENDPALALVEEIAGLHHKLITGTLPKMRRGGAVEPCRPGRRADCAVVPRARGHSRRKSSGVFCRLQGALRLLEIGCGSGVYLRHAAERNATLTALGVELQPAVAAMARANLRGWGLQGRVKVEDGDIRAKVSGRTVRYRNSLQQHLLLSRGRARGVARTHRKVSLTGRISAVDHVVPGRQPWRGGIEPVGRGDEGAGRLPAVEELVSQLRGAGLAR